MRQCDCNLKFSSRVFPKSWSKYRVTIVEKGDKISIFPVVNEASYKSHLLSSHTFYFYFFFQCGMLQDAVSHAKKLAQVVIKKNFYFFPIGCYSKTCFFVILKNFFLKRIRKIYRGNLSSNTTTAISICATECATTFRVNCVLHSRDTTAYRSNRF